MHHSYIDQYSYQESIIHRLDGRVKVVATVFYTLAVVTLPREKMGELLPFFIFPLLLIALGEIPWRFVLKHLLLVSPFILMVALFNPLYDRTPLSFGSWQIARGWITALNILIKFSLTVMALLGLVSTTPFSRLLGAFQALGCPRIMILQLSFLYRYLFITIEEIHRMVRAREARSYGKPLGAKKLFSSGGALIGALFFRSLQRAGRVYQAMCARGFDGVIRLAAPLKAHPRDWIFLGLSLAYLAFFRVLV